MEEISRVQLGSTTVKTSMIGCKDAVFVSVGSGESSVKHSAEVALRTDEQEENICVDLLC